MWKCIRCGERIEANYNFCWHCGVAKPVSKLLTSPDAFLLKDFADYTPARPRFFLPLSIGFEILYWVLLPAFIVGAAFLSIESGPWALLSPESLIYFALLELCGRLRKRFRVDSRKALTRATRNPVLYLRSFHYESVQQSPIDSDDSPITLYERENDDEVLALALRNVGPLVALGKSKGKLPPLGAIRLYFGQDEWQTAVKRLLELCQFVIIQPGYTEGTEWEILIAKDSLAPEKVIYSFLSWRRLDIDSRKREYEVFAMQIKRIYGCDLPATLEPGLHFLYFKNTQNIQNHGKSNPTEKWSPQFVYFSPLMALFFFLSAALSAVWRFMTRIRAPFPFDALPRLLRRLPVPRIFRGYSVPCVRESLRPALRAQGIQLTVWRTVAFAASAVLLAIALVYLTVLYATPAGGYKITGYDTAGIVIFQGDMRISEDPFKGTANLDFPNLNQSSTCFFPPLTSNNSASFLVSAREREHSSQPNYLELRFDQDIGGVEANRSASSLGRPLVYAHVENAKVFLSGDWYFNAPCIESEFMHGRLRIRRKFPWE